MKTNRKYGPRAAGWPLALAALLLAALLVLGGCKKTPEEELPEQEEPTPSAPGAEQQAGGDINQAAYWVDKLPDPGALVMSSAEIAAYNSQITAQPESRCVDWAAYADSLPGAELTALLAEAAAPTEERYIGERPADAAYYASLAQNRNEGAVQETNPVRFGFVCQNTILRAFPTSDPSYEFPNDLEFDLNSETLLKVWEPVAVLHTSADGAWYFVQSYNYRGWAPVGSVALCESRGQWEEYREPGAWLVVTGNRVQLGENVYNPTASGLELYMGTTLPLVPAEGVPATVDSVSTESGRVVLLPGRTGEGALEPLMALVPWNADVHEGFLPYTRENVLRQAFKLLGDRHGWSGMNKSRDATALTMDVFASFGIRLPRNSAQQAGIPGQVTSLQGMGEEEKAAAILSLPAGALLAMDGHVALYLGERDGAPYVLHSLYVADVDGGDGGRQEKMINAIVVTDLNLYLKGAEDAAEGESYLSAFNKAIEIRP